MWEVRALRGSPGTTGFGRSPSPPGACTQGARRPIVGGVQRPVCKERECVHTPAAEGVRCVRRVCLYVRVLVFARVCAHACSRGRQEVWTHITLSRLDCFPALENLC